MIFLKMRTNFYTSSTNRSRILKENHLQTVKHNKNRIKMESSHSSWEDWESRPTNVTCFPGGWGAAPSGSSDFWGFGASSGGSISSPHWHAYEIGCLRARRGSKQMSCCCHLDWLQENRQKNTHSKEMSHSTCTAGLAEGKQNFLLRPWDQWKLKGLFYTLNFRLLLKSHIVHRLNSLGCFILREYGLKQSHSLRYHKGQVLLSRAHMNRTDQNRTELSKILKFVGAEVSMLLSGARLFLPFLNLSCKVDSQQSRVKTF